MPAFYEFFAGGGMARMGLGEGWTCLFANDIDAKKADAYRDNWGAVGFRLADVAALRPADLPATADLAWASFPCQDLSLAGAGAGLRGERSGTFWSFWKLIEALAGERRAPRLIVLENVCGALASHGGRDFAVIGKALARGGYHFGAVVIDAVDFVPQSRPRLFVIGTREAPAAHLQASQPSRHHTPALLMAKSRLDETTAKKWIWWSLPTAPRRNRSFIDIIEEEPTGVRWHTRAQTAALLSMMTPLNREKVRLARKSGFRAVGGVYKRTRSDATGKKIQRAEVRFDGISGCLRTPVGGSSRQTILVVESGRVRSRLLSPREAARLMGLPDEYRLPENYNDAYHLSGDGVVVPVVRFLAEHILEPLLHVQAPRRRRKAA
jgi:DNA (cytosine-5)-methyltransferase 1